MLSTIIGIIIFLAIGALAGWLAGIIMKSEGGLVRNIILGIVGAVVGGAIAGLLGWSSGFLTLSWQSVLVAVLGACLVLFVVKLIKK